MALFPVLLLAVSVAVSAPAADGGPDPDLVLVREHQIAADGPGLLDYLRGQTLDDARRQRLEALVRQLGDRSFDKREEASQELARAGRAALPLLRPAVLDRDNEVAERARALVQEVDRGPGAGLVAAVVRLVKKGAPAGAVRVLLDYLPSAGDPYLEEELLAALVQLSPADGPLDPAWPVARNERLPLRRAAAGLVLGQRTTAEDRGLAVALLRDPEPVVRWHAARGLLVRRERAAVPALIGLLEDAPPDLAGQAREVLGRLAEEKAAGLDAADRKTARANWAAWWQANADAADLAKADAPPLLGLILGVEYNTNVVWERGRDGKARWKITAAGPMDAQVLRHNRVLIAESGAKKVTERDFQGNVLWEHAFPNEEPINCLRLRDGNTFIATRSAVYIVTPDHQERFKHPVGVTVNACRYLPGGHFLVVAANGPITELDGEGKTVRKLDKTEDGHWKDAIVLPGNRWVLSGNNKAAASLLEVDGAGKTVWEANPTEACGVEHLPSGNFLLACPHKVVEVNRQGKIVWEMAGEGGYVRRAHIR